MPETPLRLLGIGDARSVHLQRWARRLAVLGHELHVVTNRMPASPIGDGVEVYDIRRLGLLTRVRGIRRHRFGPALARLAGALDVDLVHAHGLAPYAYWAALAGVHPLVVSPWGRDALVDARVEPGRSRARRAMAAGDWFVVNSRAILAASEEVGLDPARTDEVIWHAQLSGFGPEHADRDGLRRRLGWPSDALVVTSIRSFQSRTNLDVLVRAFARLRAELPRARLLIVARFGDAKERIHALVDELELRPSVAFVEAEPPEVPELLASGDVVVSIADTDSSPASLLETMASRQPLVCNRGPSIGEWVGPGEGAEMIDAPDEEALLQALRRLLGDAALRERYGERNARVVAERVQESGPALERIYRRLLAGAGGRELPRAAVSGD